MSPTAEKRQRHEARVHHHHYRRGKPQMLVMHQVQCAGNAPAHSRHRKSGLFLDRPRLFKNDNRASALRGLRDVAGSLDDCFEDNPDISLVVVRTYDCVAYHQEIKDAFVRLPLPAADPEMAANLRPYFDFLEDQAELAEVQSESISISRTLSDAMGRLVEAEPLLFAQWEKSLVPPYLQVYHTRARARTLAQEVLDERLAAQVLLLLNYVEEAFGPEYLEADNLFKQGLVTREHVDKLFGPNDIIVCTEEGELVAYVSTLCPSPTHGAAEVNIRCYNWAFDGFFRRQEKTIDILWPSKDNGPIPITELDSYPLRFDPSGQLEKMLRERGNVFWSCRKRNFVGYTARTTSFEIQVPNPRYMIDTMTYKDLHSKDNTEMAKSRDDLGEERMNSDTPPEDPFVLLLPPKIFGFGIHDKKWRKLLVKNLRPIRWNKKAFEQLVLDPQKKELIEAKVRIHMSSVMSTDVIEGKGNGLIILLHGGPGTGKTLTAESVAELAEKPLYRVTCGDIGTDPESVERYLESVLYVGSIWKAVVLLDESDVFLEQREKTDLQRNALVSVFLRVLEYYEGILILTSNRVGIFDEAFKSRVQLALHYPPLNEEDRWKVWDNFISQLEQQQQQTSAAGIDDEAAVAKLAEGETINIKELRSKINALARVKLNGRQIRNVITTARQLALHRHQSLGYVHLDQAIRVANEFEEYVTKTQGHDAGEYARAEGLRLE
ncbi:hypothetical protein MFIFM68171_02955 [Madurella fahalii]|uniref:AAA+ ATPase domain-containing protein n=1 Tax=Madurella fahalii TaxID=1157608 RepID=A0ABQ0G4S2_9PEZI